MIVTTDGPIKELKNVLKALKLMKRTLNVFWNGEENMNSCFQLLFSLPSGSLIVGSQIEIEKVFSLAKILMNLKRCEL
jgi:hypothetical protein